MRPTSLAPIAVIALLVASPRARAEEPPPAQPVPAPAPMYTAPLYQTTQPSYVPQSVALSGPEELRNWREREPIPPGYHPVERVRRGLIIGGAVTFGTLYMFTALAAAAGQDASGGGHNELAALWIPGVGPFVEMAQTSSSTANYILAIDGIAQCAGLTMLIVGIASPRTTLVRNDLGKNGVTIQAAPIVGRGATGMGVVGTF